MIDLATKQQDGISIAREGEPEYSWPSSSTIEAHVVDRIDTVKLKYFGKGSIQKGGGKNFFPLHDFMDGFV